MKVGGNAALNEFFSKSLLSSNKDAKTKYTSKVAVAYKEKLEQRKVEDAARYVFYYYVVYTSSLTLATDSLVYSFQGQRTKKRNQNQGRLRFFCFYFYFYY